MRAIPRGSVASYGEVARRAGLPRRARLVARVLAQTEAELPWHRVVRADGAIAFAPGSPGFIAQCERLQAEGVAVRNGRVRLPAAIACPLDTALWGPAEDR